MEQLEKMLEHFFDKKCIICGDFNVDVLIDCKKQNELISLLKSYNFRHLINEITFIRNDSESCIDNFFTNLPEEYVGKNVVDHNGLADGHAGIFCDLLLDISGSKKNTSESITMVRRTFSKENNENFRKEIMKENWNSKNTTGFVETFNKVYKQSFPKRRKKLKIKKGTKITWTTKGIKASSKMKRILTHTNSCDPTIKSYRSNYIKIYRKVIKIAKKIGVQTEIEKAKNSTKGIWNCVNRHRNKNSVSLKEELLLKVNDKIVHLPQEIVNIFSDKFKFEDDSTIVNPDEAIALLSENYEKTSDNMICRATTPTEITKTVLGFKNKKSCGHDEVPITVIKDNIDILATPLSNFFNACMFEGVFPEQLKIAKILPKHKKGSKTDPSKYRPISLLTILSKIFEKILKSRLVLHLNMNNILNARQFGYRRGVGTTDAIDKLLDDIVHKINNKEKVAALFLDLSSAFDLVDHKILLQKLEFYGVRNQTLKLFESYLKNRKQFVEITNIVDGKEVTTTSEYVNIKRGVPQGSVLGPILFIIFTNDLLEYIRRSFPEDKLIVYADDTNAILSAKDMDTLEYKLNYILDNFSLWFKANNLKINTSKTSALLFKSTIRNKDSLHIRLDGEKVDMVDSVKFLGVHIDALLNWKSELKSIDSTLSSACFALRSLRDEINEEQLTMIYYALVESKLRYSIKHWGNSFDYNIKRAFILQKRAIRTIVRIPQTESCKPHFTRLKILTVPSLYILVLLTGLAKTRHEIESEDEKKRRENTRRKDLPIKFVPKFTVIKHSASYQSQVVFNKLPLYLKILISHSSFKTKLRDFLLKGCFYSLDEYLK